MERDEQGTQGTVFRADSGQNIVYLSDRPHRPRLAISPNGETYYEIKVTGLGGGPDQHVLHFVDPKTGESGMLSRDGDRVVLDGTTYTKVDKPDGPLNIVRLPTVRKLIQLFRLPDGTLIYVSADMYIKNPKTLKLFIGPAGSLSEVPIHKVEYHLDGGTTIVYTPRGVLFLPSPHNLGATPKWGDSPLESLDVGDFRIVETDNVGIVVARRHAPPG